MIGALEAAIRALAASALGDLFSGDPPPVSLSVSGDAFTPDPGSADGLAGEPRPADRADSFPFDPTGIVFDPADPEYDPARLPSFTLSQPPYEGPRRARLTTSQGDVIALRPDEVAWDPDDSRKLTLRLRPGRPLAGVVGLQVLYTVVAVFATVRASQVARLVLQTDDAARLARAEALLAGLVALNGPTLADESAVTYESGDYGASVAIKGLRLIGIGSPEDLQRRLDYQVEVEVRATRALRADEGERIARITTPGRPLDPRRPVDVEVGLDV